MRFQIMCPACGPRMIRFEEFESMILLGPSTALVSFRCPSCGMRLSITTDVPAESAPLFEALCGTTNYESVSERVWSESLQFGVECVPLGDFYKEVDSPFKNEYLEYFSRQLDSVETVDDALAEIDAGYFPKED